MKRNWSDVAFEAFVVTCLSFIIFFTVSAIIEFARLVLQ